MEEPLKILVVDDERMYRVLLEKTLLDEGYRVETADGGPAALELIAQKEFNVILTDLKMPEVDGIEVLKAAKARNAETVVIIVTGYASLDTALTAIKDGVYDYITKPFQLEEIKLTLKNAGERLRLEKSREELLHKLEQAYSTIEELVNNRNTYNTKVQEIDKQLASRQKELADGMRRLRGFHDRVLPIQFGGGANPAGPAKPEGGDATVLTRLREATDLHQAGAIDEREFKLLKKKILTE